MDAVEFLKAKNQMCKAYYRCDGCPLSKNASCAVWCQESPKEAVVIVEKWLEAHPPKTRQSEFLKQCPEAGIDDYGVLRVCPSLISTSHRNTRGGCAHIDSDCSDCRREFWMQEVE
jgi:hypothetical protein